MNPRLSTLAIIVVLLSAVAALHHHDSEFSTLLQQQSKFENKLTKIEQEMALTMNKLGQAGSTN